MMTRAPVMVNNCFHFLLGRTVTNISTYWRIEQPGSSFGLMFLLLPIKVTMRGAYSSWAGTYPLDLSVSPVDNSGTPLIRPPLGPKKIGCINVVAVLMRAFLQENVWWFLPGSKKKGP